MFNPNDEYKDYSLAELAEFTKKIDELPITDERNDTFDKEREGFTDNLHEFLNAYAEFVKGISAMLAEGLSQIDWNALLEAMQEVQKNAGDNDNSDNLCNIGDDLMDQ